MDQQVDHAPSQDERISGQPVEPIEGWDDEYQEWLGEMVRLNATDLVALWQGGDEDAAAELHKRFLRRLVSLAKRHLNEKYRSQIDASDLVQSIFGSFFREARNTKEKFSDDTGFWKWMATIALNKTFKKIDYLNAQKRNKDREERVEDFEQYAASCLSRNPTGDHVVIFSDLLESLEENLRPDEQAALAMRLDGHSQQEIADQLSTNTREVRRKFERIREAAAGISDVLRRPR